MGLLVIKLKKAGAAKQSQATPHGAGALHFELTLGNVPETHVSVRQARPCDLGRAPSGKLKREAAQS